MGSQDLAHVLAAEQRYTLAAKEFDAMRIRPRRPACMS